MEVTGKIVDANIDFISGATKITLEINEKNTFMQGYDEIKDIPKLSIVLKPYKRKRSLDANAYAWVLIDKIAAAMSITKEEVYKNSIREIGGNAEIICVQNDAVKDLCSVWERNGLGWQTETFPSKIAGCTNVILYYGSSVYNVDQMGRLIDNIIQDCKNLGIQTMPPSEIAKLKSLWGDKN